MSEQEKPLTQPDGIWRWGQWDYAKEVAVGHVLYEFRECTDPSSEVIDVFPTGAISEWRLGQEDHKPLLEVKVTDYDGNTEIVCSEENKRRIVASVNALRHLSVEEIEAIQCPNKPN